MALLQIVGALVVLAGALFLMLAAVGLIRMPDPYNRIQAGTKASTLGVVLALIGIGLYEPGWMAKMIVIAVFVLITNPVSSHALARAAHAAGVPLTPDSVQDALRSPAPEPEPEPDAGAREAEA